MRIALGACLLWQRDSYHKSIGSVGWRSPALGDSPPDYQPTGTLFYPSPRGHTEKHERHRGGVGGQQLSVDRRHFLSHRLAAAWGVSGRVCWCLEHGARFATHNLHRWGRWTNLMYHLLDNSAALWQQSQRTKYGVSPVASPPLLSRSHDRSRSVRRVPTVVGGPEALSF